MFSAQHLPFGKRLARPSLSSCNCLKEQQRARLASDRKKDKGGQSKVAISCDGRACVGDGSATAAASSSSLSGPVFLKEPSNRIDFSNTTGTVVECAATGNPRPEILWIKADGSPVTDVPGLRQVQTSGSLVFPPFRAEDYKQEVHAQFYRCVARNSAGSIVSRDIHVRAVVSQEYDTDASKEYVIRGNSALLKCQFPSFMADHLQVESWMIDDGTIVIHSERYDGKYMVLPSGELHIRDVSPEDGYKSYRCRTKHRLTGETRLSATAGRLVVTEPTGSSAPRFPTESSSSTLKKSSSISINLLCPAQAYPAPLFRPTLHLCSEPTSSSAPRFASESFGFVLRKNLGMSINLLCPAQAFPAPLFRTDKQQRSSFIGRLLFCGFKTSSRLFVDVNVPSAGFPSSAFQNRLAVRLLDLPAARLSISSKISGPVSRYSVRLRVTQRPFSEPTSSSAPRFASRSSVHLMRQDLKASFSLFCPAQAYPAPVFRLAPSKHSGKIGACF
ncbi:hypothetical protein OUZ56_013733 [Daphnia magna]|uniref:Ig-like domain-containing protein n=1 Tax=Daphnia magna TaxID=35525 RepID=A0ABQ9Z6R9_9CRUS|nr:hypothetical protein OUZ56_013733 [Daphnia magna]